MHCLKKSGVDLLYRRNLLKCLFKQTRQSYLTLTRNHLSSVLEGNHSDMLSRRQLMGGGVNICYWCKMMHMAGISRQLPLQTASCSSNDLLERQTCKYSIPLKLAWKRHQVEQQNIRFLHSQKLTLAQSSKGYVPLKVPAAKIAPFKRVGRRKQGVEIDDAIHHQNVVAYSVGEEIDLSSLKDDMIATDVYSVVVLPRDITDVLMVTAKYKVNGQAREAFFFRDGGVAFWHMSDSERTDLWNLARKFAVNKYAERSIIEECESLSVIYDKETKLKGDVVHVKTPQEGEQFDEESTLHKYTFSNALSQSEQFMWDKSSAIHTDSGNYILDLQELSLSMSEAHLEQFIEQLEPETQKLRQGIKSSLRRKDINMRLGEIFQLRHVINLESGYLDAPDIYWEREELEGLYRQMIMYLIIPKRIEVLNERLNYCSEILQLLNNQLNDQHHVRLEWIIIFLILIEVVFECIHYAEKYSLRNAKTED